MCYFPKSVNPNSPASRKGIREFGCGVCPECLRKKSNYWSLKCTAQSKTMCGMMITLTYDQYVRDSNGNIVGERLPDDMSVHKRDVQLFVKRLRKYIDYYGHGEKIKYLISAEYGKRTHRPHYHAIIFGYQFADIVPYKKSKRGNMIYKSATLNKIWKNGICTVDSININGAVARYCTKYCMKDAGADDTFMLFSRGIGDEELLRDFNGRSYYVEGRECAIPRMIWLKWCERNLTDGSGYATHIYRREDRENQKARERLYKIRDSSTLYQAYLKYWQSKIEVMDKPPVLQRILALPNDKYFGYKQAALKALEMREKGWEEYPDPRSDNFKPMYNALWRRHGLLPYFDDNGELSWYRFVGGMRRRPRAAIWDFDEPCDWGKIFPCHGLVTEQLKLIL